MCKSFTITKLLNLLDIPVFSYIFIFMRSIDSVYFFIKESIVNESIKLFYIHRNARKIEYFLQAYLKHYHNFKYKPISIPECSFC